jgi:hypothetical protein
VRVLAKFGARHVNLVVHSKAGLFAREFLQMNALTDLQSQIGVISLSTLDTPHHGSVLADTVVRFRNSNFGGTVDRFLKLISTEPGFIGPGADDMAVADVRTFNDDHLEVAPLFRLLDSNGNTFVTTPKYYSISADADRDGDGKITAADNSLYPVLYANVAYNIVARGRSVSLIAALGLLHASVSSVSDPIKNDTAVSIDSARYLGFSELFSYVGINGRSHKTIRSPDVAALVLQKIRDAESLQPTQ